MSNHSPEQFGYVGPEFGREVDPLFLFVCHNFVDGNDVQETGSSREDGEKKKNVRDEH